MERLTKRNESDTGYYYPMCFEKCEGLGASYKCDKCELVESACNKLGEYEDAEEKGMLLRLPYPLGTETIENCNSCNATEKIAELPVLTLAKFSEDLVDMAKENWCESHVIMLRRLILATLQGTRYDETLLPEEQELKNMEREG